MNSQKSFFLLSQEGHLIKSCLTSGLTELHKANVYNKGNFYSALFNLSIGMERLLKVIVIVDYMLRNKLATPSSKELKNYGHNILDLYNSSFNIANKRNIEILDLSSFDTINTRLINLLNDFSKITRYHNLDTLSNAKTNQDPLYEWNEIIGLVLLNDVSDKQRNRVLIRSKHIAERIQDITFFSHHGLDQNKLTLEEGLSLPELHELAIKHIILRLINILYPFRDLIRDLCIESYNFNPPAIPQLQEFLEWLWNDRQYVLKKRKWN